MEDLMTGTEQPRKHSRRKTALKWTVAAALIGLLAVPAAYSQAQSYNGGSAISGNLYGDYLSGLVARNHHDISTAANFYSKALQLDPSSNRLLEQTFLLEVAAANWKPAVSLARRLVKVEPSQRIARFLLGCNAFKRGDYDAARIQFSAAREGPIADLASTLARAWSYEAEGKTSAAFTTLDTLSEADWAQFYQRYHRGLIADLAGRHQAAAAAFASAFKRSPGTARVAEAYARHVAKFGSRKKAIQILRQSIAKGGPRPTTQALLTEIKSGKTPKLQVNSPAEGVAEVFYGIGSALASEGGLDTGVIFLQLSVYMNPNMTLAHIALAEAYDGAGKYKMEIQSLDRVPASSPLWLNVQIQKALALNALNKVDQAKAILVALSKKYPKDVRPLDALGNILRAHERYAEALPYYSQAIALTKKPSHSDWTLFYSRGVCYERLNQWSKAQADLKKALKLSPDEPLVLNYLGYTWANKDTNLKMALDYIQKAVRLKPEDGYYIDSLGWAYYRLGNLPQAVRELEHAVELKPDDPTINDHLGDVYWRVGRKLEAKYQWQQSLELKPDKKEKESLRKKLASGLPPLPETKAADGSTGRQTVTPR